MTGTPLRIGLLSGEKILPFVIAQRANGFERHGIVTEISIVDSAAQRDLDLMAGRLDVVLMNLVSVVALALTGIQLTVLTVLSAEPGAQGMFQLLARAVPIPEPARVGYSRHTIADYSVSSLLPLAGLTRAGQIFVDVPDLVHRGRSLMAGVLDLAVLPAPVGAWCQDRGAVLLADDRDLSPPPPTLCMLTSRLTERRAEVDVFLDAYDDAVRFANADPTRLAELLDASGVPVGQGWCRPLFSERSDPTLDTVRRTLAWCAEIGLSAGSVRPSAADTLRAITTRREPV